MIINGYELQGKLTTDNSGFSKWGFATKDGKEYFIKEFISPVYPIYKDILDPEIVAGKKKICEDYEYKKKLLYRRINECSDGNLVRIQHFFRYGSKYYIIMEKIPYINVINVLKSSFSVRERLIRIISHSIRGMHNGGLVHGDIKLENLLFQRLPSGSITAKVIDFDNSFWEESPPAPTEEIHGDPIYMAPETFQMMAEEKGSLTRAIDIFALGILFCQILTGQLPYFDKDKYNYPFESVLSDQPLICPESLPVEYKKNIEGMLDADPLKRISHWQSLEKKSNTESIAAIKSKTTPEPTKEKISKKYNSGEDYFYQAGDL